MRTGQENWRDCARRRVDGFTLVIICWRRIRRRSRLWRCQLRRVSASQSRRVQLTLWRSAGSSQTWRAQRDRPGNKDGRFEANDLAF